MSSRATRTLYVGNLPGDIREREVEDLFYKYGLIVDIDLKIPPRAPAYCFIDFEDAHDAEDAIRGRDGYNFDGNRLRVELTHGGRGQSSTNGRYSSYSGAGGRNGGVSPRSEYRVLITGLPSSASRQDLKDHMRGAGDVGFSQVFRDSSGTTGIVDYTNYSDMKYAIRKLDDSKFRNAFSRGYIRVKAYVSKRGISRSPSRSYSHSSSRSVSRSRSRTRNRSRSRSLIGSRSRSRSRSKSPKHKAPPRSMSPSKPRPPPRRHSLSRSLSRSRSRSRTPQRLATSYKPRTESPRSCSLIQSPIGCRSPSSRSRSRSRSINHSKSPKHKAPPRSVSKSRSRSPSQPRPRLRRHSLSRSLSRSRTPQRLTTSYKPRTQSPRSRSLSRSPSRSRSESYSRSPAVKSARSLSPPPPRW